MPEWQLHLVAVAAGILSALILAQHCYVLGPRVQESWLGYA
jgi:hypothetical protein